VGSHQNVNRFNPQNLSAALFMYLSQLLSGIYAGPINADPIIQGLCQDSRQLKSGDLFFAYPGLGTDGRHFIQEAIAKGAAAILYESEEHSNYPAIGIPLLAITDLSSQLGLIAARFYDYPSRYLTVLGNYRDQWQNFLHTIFSR
jgi:UDP-N-acetylmuramoyl-L-alanyl-D-glutamate--2,6-diaminopimelate ligase